MMNRTVWIAFLLVSLSSCAAKKNKGDELMSLQLIDRNGFSETISTSDRLDTFQKLNFMESQPYQKIVRLFKRNTEGKNCSLLTTYHSSGGVWQFLEVVNGRANGAFREWYPSGKLKIESQVVEGLGDLSDEASTSWVFHGISKAYSPQGKLVAEISYDRGDLHGECRYYHSNGIIKQVIPYLRGQIHGNIHFYDEKEKLIGKAKYKDGIRHGLTVHEGTKAIPRYSEEYQEGLLMNAVYYNFAGKIAGQIEKGRGIQVVYEEGKVRQLTNFEGGAPEGDARIFNEKGDLESQFVIKNGQKQGLELLYFPGTSTVKVSLEWYEDELHGKVKTYYPTGVVESEREFYRNQKQGLSFAFYKEGSLMLMEEYERDTLIKGAYYKKGEKEAVTTVERGDGIATLFDPEGHFLKRITYRKGLPLDE